MSLVALQNKDIKGLTLPSGKELKCSFFADDATFFLANDRSVGLLIEQMNIFGKLSGLRVNIEKTEIMKIGSHKNSDNHVYGIEPTKEPVKMLGIFVGHSNDKCYQYNLQPRIAKLKDKLDIWRIEI
jgi:hypothetical protein